MDPDAARYPHICPLCSARFRFPAGLRYHMKSKHPWVRVGSIDDKDDDDDVETMATMTMPLETEDPLSLQQDPSTMKGRFMCKLCPPIPHYCDYTNINFLRQHLKKHKVEGPNLPDDDVLLSWTRENKSIKCWICPQRFFTSGTSLKFHFNSDHLNGPSSSSTNGELQLRETSPMLWCILCIRPNFGNPTSLKAHLRDSHGLMGSSLLPKKLVLKTWTSVDLPLLKCWVCEKSFISSAGLESHIKKKHLKEKNTFDVDPLSALSPSSSYSFQLNAVPNSFETGKYSLNLQCLFCRNKTFNHAQNLRMHLKHGHKLSKERLIPSGDTLRSWTTQSWASLKCWVCGDNSLSTPQSLLTHLLTMHLHEETDDQLITYPQPPSRAAELQCIFCTSSNVFFHVKRLRRHLQIVHGFNKERLLPSGDALRSWTPNSGVSLMCWVCSDNSLTSTTSLLQHIQMNHINEEVDDDDNNIIFPEAFYQQAETPANTYFSSAITTTNHSSSQNRYRCIFCPASIFPNKLRGHLTSFHGLSKERLLPSLDILRSWKDGDVNSLVKTSCWICSEIFMTPEDLMTHIQFHGMEDEHDPDNDNWITTDTNPDNDSLMITSVRSLTTSSDLSNNNSSNSDDIIINYSKFFCMNCSVFFDERKAFDYHSCNVRKENDKATEEEEIEIIDVKLENGIFPD